MAVINISPPFPSFFDTDGSPLEDGLIYIGQANLNPTIAANQVPIYADSTLLAPLAQPVRTLGGYPIINGAATKVYAGVGDYSIVVYDKHGRLVYAALSNKTKFGLIDLSTDVTGFLPASMIEYPPTLAEIAAGAIITNKSIPSHDYGGIIYPIRYGFLPTASAAANVNALATAALVLAQATTIKIRDAVVYAVDTGTMPEVHLTPGAHDINNVISWPAYVTIRGDRTIIRQTDVTKVHFTTAPSYRVEIEGITFVGGKNAFWGTGVNTDTSRVVLRRCNFQTDNLTNYAVLVDTQTCNTLLDECWVMNSPLFADIYGDFCEIRNCWVIGYYNATGLKPDNTDSVANHCRYMRICGGSWVPEAGPGLSVNTRWISNRGGFLSVEDVQFGGENAGLPTIYEFGSAVVVGPTFLTLSGVVVKNCQLSCGHQSRADRGILILQGSVPSIIDIEDGFGSAAIAKLINDNAMTAPTLATWLLTNIYNTNAKISIRIRGMNYEPAVTTILGDQMPAALLPFAKTDTACRGVNPGYNQLGPINTPMREYDPDWSGVAALALSAVAGKVEDIATTAYQNMLSVTKSANGAVGMASCIIEVEVSAAIISAVPVYTANSAKFRITLVAGAANAITGVITTLDQNNIAQGGAGPGNVLGLQILAGATATSATIQVRANDGTMVKGSIAWNAKMISVTANNNTDGKVFSIASF
jgi:hypothetical protein